MGMCMDVCVQVPLETTIAHASFDRSNAEAHEKDEVKRKVLGYQAQVDGGTLLNQVSFLCTSIRMFLLMFI